MIILVYNNRKQARAYLVHFGNARNNENNKSIFANYYLPRDSIKNRMHFICILSRIATDREQNPMTENIRDTKQTSNTYHFDMM